MYLFKGFRQLRWCSLAVLAALATLVAACTSGSSVPSHASVTPPAAIRVGTTLPATTVADIVADLNTASLKGQALTVQGQFNSGGSDYTVVTNAGGKQLVSTALIKSAADELTGLIANGTVYEVPLKLGNQVTIPVFQVRERFANRRLVAYIATADQIRRLRRDVHVSDTTTSFTHYGPHYTGIFVSDVQSGATTVGQPVSQGITATYVELCQAIFNVVIAPDNTASLRANPKWANHVNDVALGGQEAVCNSLGVVAALARASVPYAVYKAAVNARANQTRTIRGGVQIPLPLIDELTYNLFKK